MKGCQKKGGLYGYLNVIGVLSNGNEEEINKHKRIYWANYRKLWKKNKRQQSKIYVLMFSFSEARLINQKAGKLAITPVNYIKHTALNSNDKLGPVLLGKVREQLVLYGSKIEEIIDKDISSEGIKNKIRKEIGQMEEVVLDILHKTKSNDDH